MRIQKILVPTDFSPDAGAAARLAAEVAQRFDASLTLFHVYQLGVYVTAEGGVLQTSAAHLAKQAQLVDDQLESARQSLDDVNVPIATASAAGDPAHQIVVAAEDYDLVVMGSRGHTGLLHLLLGSVTEKVVRHCRRPVLTVRSPSSPQRDALSAHSHSHGNRPSSASPPRNASAITPVRRSAKASA
jgi:nucleotide-binding universal stress UspA family protein